MHYKRDLLEAEKIGEIKSRQDDLKKATWFINDMISDLEEAEFQKELEKDQPFIQVAEKL